MLAEDLAALNQRLERRLHFTSDDLRANCEHRLTDDQHALVRSKQRMYVRNGSIALVVMWVFFTVLMTVPVILEGMKPQDLAVLPFSLGLVTLLFAGVGIGGRIYARDLMRGKISSADGRAVPKRVQYGSRYGHGKSYELRIGRRKFLMMSESELSAFETGAHYRVYYIRYAPLHVLLSAEALSAPKSSE